MSLYKAPPEILSRARELARAVRSETADSEIVRSTRHAIAAAEAMLDAELGLWSDPTRKVHDDELAVLTAELAATWVCLELLQFLGVADDLRRRVAEGWSEKLTAWVEHGYEVAATMGYASGDFQLACDYLRQYTDELLNGPEWPW